MILKMLLPTHAVNLSDGQRTSISTVIRPFEILYGLDSCKIVENRVLTLTLELLGKIRVEYRRHRRSQVSCHAQWRQLVWLLVKWWHQVKRGICRATPTLPPVGSNALRKSRSSSLKIHLSSLDVVLLLLRPILLRAPSYEHVAVLTTAYKGHFQDNTGIARLLRSGLNSVPAPSVEVGTKL